MENYKLSRNLFLISSLFHFIAFILHLTADSDVIILYLTLAASVSSLLTAYVYHKKKEIITKKRGKFSRG